MKADVFRLLLAVERDFPLNCKIFARQIFQVGRVSQIFNLDSRVIRFIFALYQFHEKLWCVDTFCFHKLFLFCRLTQKKMHRPNARYLCGFVVLVTLLTFLGYLVVIRQQDVLDKPMWNSIKDSILENNKSGIDFSVVVKQKGLRDDDYGRLIDMEGFSFTRSHKGCNELENKPKIVILVHSAPGNFAKRTTIRDTWGYKDPRSLLLFVFGAFKDSDIEMKLLWETMVHGDMVQGNFIDSYRNLTYKNTALLKWFVYNCPDANFLLKCDDDVFVNTPLMYSYLEKPSEISKPFHNGKLLFCNHYVGMPIIREVKNKWYVSEKEYPGKDYPPYCPGFTILYSADVVLELYKAIQILPYFWVDDVHVTGDANLIANISFSPTHDLILRNVDQRKDMLDGKLLVENTPFLFGFYNIGDGDMRKVWALVDCRGKSTQYCKTISGIEGTSSLS